MRYRNQIDQLRKLLATAGPDKLILIGVGDAGYETSDGKTISLEEADILEERGKVLVRIEGDYTGI